MNNPSPFRPTTEVPEGGEVYYLPYQASETGVFVATVEARNMINGTTGTFKVEIVPYIVQAEWTITTEKPWVRVRVRDGGKEGGRQRQTDRVCL